MTSCPGLPEMEGFPRMQDFQCSTKPVWGNRGWLVTPLKILREYGFRWFGREFQPGQSDERGGKRFQVCGRQILGEAPHTHTSDLTSWSPHFFAIPFLLVWTGPGTSASQQEHTKEVVTIPC